MKDEMNVTVTGLPGDFCSPQCDSSQNCPTVSVRLVAARAAELRALPANRVHTPSPACRTTPLA